MTNKIRTMSAEKTNSVILSATPYRESSSILRLFTRTRGLIHGIAKGVRKGGKSSTPLDRGFLMEAQLYYKPNRELHTIGSPHIINFFPRIRSDITKSAIRDIALELYLKSIPQSDPHPELFDLIVEFFADVEEASNPEATFPLLWRFADRYCLMMGYGSAVSSVDEINGDPPACCPKQKYLRITGLLLSYCCRHLDIRGGQLNSFAFLETVLL